MWDFIGQRYGERTAAQLNDLLQLKPTEQERIWKLLEGYSKLDNDDRIVLLSRAYQILEDMLAVEKYSKQEGGKAVWFLWISPGNGSCLVQDGLKMKFVKLNRSKSSLQAGLPPVGSSGST